MQRTVFSQMVIANCERVVYFEMEALREFGYVMCRCGAPESGGVRGVRAAARCLRVLPDRTRRTSRSAPPAARPRRLAFTLK